MSQIDQLLAEAQDEIRAGLAGTLAECLTRCNHAIELIQQARDAS